MTDNKKDIFDKDTDTQYGPQGDIYGKSDETGEQYACQDEEETIAYGELTEQEMGEKE